MKKVVEFIENLQLIENNLNHILYEFDSENPSYFRIAIECHNLLMRTMVEVLRGISNSTVTHKFSNKDKKMIFQVGNRPEVLIKKTNVDSCNYAWRFSLPEEKFGRSQRTNIKRGIESNDYLLGFYDLLAMIQSEYFIKYYTGANTIKISDKELSDLEWLHQEIRNKYEHFIPKSYGAPINDLLLVSQICIRICKEILVKPTNIYFMYDDSVFEQVLDEIYQKLDCSFVK